MAFHSDRRSIPGARDLDDDAVRLDEEGGAVGRPKMRYGEKDMDWKPLEAIVGTADLENWMWMHCTSCASTGADVHFYKHVWSRRYLRLDADGRVYKELRDGTPVPLRGCGGGTLMLLLLIATAPFDRGMPATVSLPEAAREPARSKICQNSQTSSTMSRTTCGR